MSKKRQVTVTFHAQEEPVYYFLLSETNVAFANACARGVMRRTKEHQELAENDTQLWEYLGDHRSPKGQVFHNFRHVGNRQKMMVPAPEFYDPPVQMTRDTSNNEQYGELKPLGRVVYA